MFASVVRLALHEAFKSQNSWKRFSISNVISYHRLYFFTILFIKKLYIVNRIYRKYIYKIYL